MILLTVVIVRSAIVHRDTVVTFNSNNNVNDDKVLGEKKIIPRTECKNKREQKYVQKTMYGRRILI